MSHRPSRTKKHALWGIPAAAIVGSLVWHLTPGAPEPVAAHPHVKPEPDTAKTTPTPKHSRPWRPSADEPEHAELDDFERGSEVEFPEEDLESQEQVRREMLEAEPHSSTPAQRLRAFMERDAEISALERSGEADATLERTITGLAQDLSTTADRIGVWASFSPLTCHAAGCYVHVRLESERDAETLSEELHASGSFADWEGDTFASGMIDTDSEEVETTLIFYTPVEIAVEEG